MCLKKKKKKDDQFLREYTSGSKTEAMQSKETSYPSAAINRLEGDKI